MVVTWSPSRRMDRRAGSLDEVRLEVGVHDENKFNEMAAPIEAKHDATWLRRRKGADGASIASAIRQCGTTSVVFSRARSG